MTLRRMKPRTTHTIMGITTIHREIIPRRTTVRRKTRITKVRLIQVVAFSVFILPRGVVQGGTTPTAYLHRGCTVCKTKNRSKTYVLR